MSQDNLPRIDTLTREYEFIKDSLRVDIPLDDIDENGVGYKLSEIRTIKDEKILRQIASKRPDIYLWLTSLKRSLTPIEFDIAVSIAIQDYPDKLEDYNKEKDESAVFAVAAIYHSVTKDKRQKTRLDELKPLFRIKTLQPVQDSFVKLVIFDQPNAVLNAFYTSTLLSEGVVHRLGRAAVNVGDTLAKGSLLGFGTAIYTHSIGIATTSAVVAGTAIAATFAGSHIDTLQVFNNQYSIDDIDRIKQNLVLFNEAIKLRK